MGSQRVGGSYLSGRRFFSLRSSAPIKLASMGAAYFAFALVIGRYAESLVNALGRAEQEAHEAAEAEKQAPSGG